MAITITAKLDASGVKTGAAQIENALDGMASEGVQATDKLDQAASELLGSIDDLKNKAGALELELLAMAEAGERSMRGVENAAENSAKSIQRVGDTASRTGKSISESGGSIQSTVTALSTGYLAVVDILKKGYEAALKFDAAMRKMAENGNEGAAKVVTSLDKIWDRLDKIGSDPTTQRMFEGIADGADMSADAVGGLMSAWTSFSNSASRTAVVFGEAFGVLEDGAIAAHDEMTKMDEEMRNSYERRKQEAEEEKKRLKEEEETKKRIGDIEADLDRQRTAIRGHEDEGYLKRMKNEEEVRKYIERETEELRAKAKEGEMSDAERERRLEGIRLSEQRLIDIEKERWDERKKQIKEEEEADEQAIKDAEELRKREHEERMKRIDEEKAAKEKAEQEKLDAERRAIDERKRLLGGSDVDGAKAVLGSQSRDAVREAYSQAKANQAARQAQLGGDSQEEIARQRKRALELARRGFDNGTADKDEIRAVQVNMANKTINAAQQSGNVSKETARALREGIGEMAKVQNELEGVQQEIAYLKKLQEGVNDQGKRRRAQVAGAGR